MQPLGSLLIGTVSQYIGTSTTILFEGISALLIAIVFRPLLKKELLAEKDKTIMAKVEDETIQLK